MGTENQSSQVSAFTLLFLCNQALLLGVALYSSNVTAGVFFWLGVAFLLSRLEPIEFRYCALLFWLAITLAILAYLIAPRITFSDFDEIPNSKVLAGSLLYLVAAILVGGAMYRAFMLPRESLSQAKGK